MVSTVVSACFRLLLQTVWVVDDNGGPGVNFTDLPPAVAAAADGDVLDVRSGAYNHFALSGKGLRILGEDRASTFVRNPFSPASGTTSVSSVPAGSVAYFERLTFGYTTFLPAPQVVSVSGATTRAVFNDVAISVNGASPWMGSQVLPALSVSEAEVHLFDCALRGTAGCPCVGGMGGTIAGAPAVSASNGARVEVVSSDLRGGVGSAGSSGMSLGIASAGGHGIQVTSSAGTLSRMWVADSKVEGGAGATSPIGIGAAGGAGILVDSSFLRVSGGPGASVEGGGGGGTTSIAPGGFGILSSGTATVDVHSSVAVLGGSSASGPSAPTSGPGITLGLPPLPELDVTGNLSISGGTATIAVSDGPPAAPLALAVVGAPGYAPVPAPFLGEVVIGLSPSTVLVTGSLSPAGGFSLAVPLGGLPPSAAWTPFHIQGAALDAGGVWRLSNGAVAILRP